MIGSKASPYPIRKISPAAVLPAESKSRGRTSASERSCMCNRPLLSPRLTAKRLSEVLVQRSVSHHSDRKVQGNGRHLLVLGVEIAGADVHAHKPRPSSGSLYHVPRNFRTVPSTKHNGSVAVE